MSSNDDILKVRWKIRLDLQAGSEETVFTILSTVTPPPAWHWDASYSSKATSFLFGEYRPLALAASERTSSSATVNRV